MDAAHRGGEDGRRRERSSKRTANGELVQAIQSTGDMTVQEYQQISRRAEGDQALQERIMKIVQSGEPQPQPQPQSQAQPQSRTRK